MHTHLLRHHAPATNGAPQTVAVGFASLIFFTFLLPFAEVSGNGATAPGTLLQLVRTDAGFNVFVLALLLCPFVGIGVAMRAHSAWRVFTMGVAAAALLMILLAIVTLSRGLQSATQGMNTVSLGIGSYVLLLGYGILAVATGVTAFRARHTD